MTVSIYATRTQNRIKRNGYFLAETYGTPCSTPPGSVASDSPSASFSAPFQDNSISLADDSLPKESLSETSLHQKLYDRLENDLFDLRSLSKIVL